MHTINELSWDFPNPHILKFQIIEDNIDSDFSDNKENDGKVLTSLSSQFV